jgi:hypothetical protein
MVLTKQAKHIETNPEIYDIERYNQTKAIESFCDIPPHT